MKTMKTTVLSAATAAALILGMAVAGDADARRGGAQQSSAQQHSARQSSARQNRAPQPRQQPQVRRATPRLPVGHRVSALPRGHARIKIGRSTYLYHGGVFYVSTRGGFQVVAAPIGAVVKWLPSGYTKVYVGARPYYVFDDTYFVWDSARRGYVVVRRPVEPFQVAGLIAYPSVGQGPEQQARDRYECHAWAAMQSDYDPSLDPAGSRYQISLYDSSLRACLDGRGYTVR